MKFFFSLKFCAIHSQDSPKLRLISLRQKPNLSHFDIWLKNFSFSNHFSTLAEHCPKLGRWGSKVSKLLRQKMAMVQVRAIFSLPELTGTFSLPRSFPLKAQPLAQTLSPKSTRPEKGTSISCLGSGCSTAVVHTPAEQNFWGRGFKSRRMLGFFLLFSIPSVVRP